MLQIILILYLLIILQKNHKDLFVEKVAQQSIFLEPADGPEVFSRELLIAGLFHITHPLKSQLGPVSA